MLKLGDKNIKKLYQGDKLITKACLGDKIIHHVETTFLDYVEFDGESYINTGIYATTNTRVETIFYATVQNTGFYGTYAGSQKFSAYINGNWRIDSTETYIRNTQGILVNSNHDKNGVVINGVLNEYISTPTEFIGNQQMFLGWVNGAPTSWVKFQGKLYKFQVYENNILVGDFKPCINPNGIVCFYDTVTKKYFYNQGTGTLTAGPELSPISFPYTIVGSPTIDSNWNARDFTPNDYIEITDETQYSGDFEFNVVATTDSADTLDVRNYTLLKASSSKGIRGIAKHTASGTHKLTLSSSIYRTTSTTSAWSDSDRDIGFNTKFSWNWKRVGNSLTFTITNLSTNTVITSRTYSLSGTIVLNGCRFGWSNTVANGAGWAGTIHLSECYFKAL